MKTAIILLVAAALTPSSHEEEFKVTYRQPSKIVVQIETLTDAKLIADDYKGTIRATGSEAAVEQIGRFIRMYDVKSMEVRLRFKLDSPVQKVSMDGTVTIPNNVSFTFEDSESMAKVSCIPRITNRGTITYLVKVEIDGSVFQTTKESRNTDQLKLSILEMSPVGDKAKEALKTKDQRLWPTLYFTGSVVESLPR